MNLDEIFKVLDNKHRLLFLKWLKNSEVFFPHQHEPLETGVCVGQIQKKSGKPISTVSEHLSLLQQAGFLTSTKKGKWIYYKRDEKHIAAVSELIKKKL